MTERTLVLGGARAGKSAHAEGLLDATAPVTYLATGQRRPDDTDWQARIAEHVARRPAAWRTVEVGEPDELPAFLRGVAPDEPVLVDDVATWLTSVVDATGGWDGGQDALLATRQHYQQLVAAVGECRGRLVLVSAEVGLGVVPETSAGRLFRDELGVLNAHLSDVCDRVVFVVAGIPVTLRANALPAPPASTTTAATTTLTTTTARTTTATTADTTTADTTTAGTTTAGTEPSASTTSAGTTTAGTSVDVAPAVEFPPVTPPDASVRAEALARQDRLTKPTASLGRLEELGVWVAACQGNCPPRPFTRPRVVVFAGDHGIAAHGVSAYPSEVTGQMVGNFLAGGAAVNVLADAAGATVRVVDMAVDADTPDQITGYKVRRGSGSIDREDALTGQEAHAAIEAGRAIADEEVDGGADLLVVGDMGIGNTTPAAVLIAALTGAEPVAVVGRGTGIDDAGWTRKTAAIRDALRRARPVSADPVALLRTAGGADLAAMAGFLAQAAVRRTPVLLDGVVVGAAALVAGKLAPGAHQWWMAGHRSVEPAHTLALEHLGLTPLLDLRMRLGEGSGAVAALPLVTMAVRVLGEMATFGDAGVSERDVPVVSS